MTYETLNEPKGEINFDARELVKKLSSLSEGEGDRRLPGFNRRIISNFLGAVASYSVFRNQVSKEMEKEDGPEQFFITGLNKAQKRLYNSSQKLADNLMSPGSLGIEDFLQDYTGRKLSPAA